MTAKTKVEVRKYINMQSVISVARAVHSPIPSGKLFKDVPARIGMVMFGSEPWFKHEPSRT